MRPPRLVRRALPRRLPVRRLPASSPGHPRRLPRLRHYPGITRSPPRRPDTDLPGLRRHHPPLHLRALRLRRQPGPQPALPPLRRDQSRSALLEKAAVCLDKSRQILEQLGDRQWQAYTLRSIGQLHREQDKWEQSMTYFGEALAIFRSIGNRRLEGETLVELGLMHARNDDPIAARAAWREALVDFQELGMVEDASQVDALLQAQSSYQK